MDDLKEKEQQNEELSEDMPSGGKPKAKAPVLKKKTNTVTHKPKVKYIRPKKGNRIALSLVFTFMILGISVVSSVAIIFLAREMFGIDKSASSYTVRIPENATVDQVIEIITTEQENKRKEPIIKVDSLFRLMVKFKQSRDDEFEFVSGEHTLSPNMGYSDIITELSSYYYKAKETKTLTFPEGIYLKDAAQMLESEGICSAAIFTYYFNNGIEGEYSFMDNVPKATAVDLRFYRMEGYLFPDTYEFYVADDINDLEQEDYEIIVRKFYDNFEEKYTQELSDRAAEIGMTMDQVVTLASIVQAEAADTADMANVASVFTNRLKNTDLFPHIASDPTEKYANQVIKELSNPVNELMMAAYDTYKTAGLPPGPICNPGIEAIKAVLYPNDTDYYYFCANIETKEVYYASTYDQHVANCAAAGIDPDLY